MPVLCACGVDTNGLLDVVDGAEEGAKVDVSAADVATSGDAGASTDVRPVIDQASPDVAMGGPDAPSDAQAGEAGDAGADTDARIVAPSDGQVDAPDDGQGDGSTDAPNVPPDAAPWPIVWDGGALAGPQPFDSDWILFCSTLAACGQMPSVSACMSHLPQPSSPDALIPPFSAIASVDTASPNCASVGAALGDGSACPSTTSDVCAGNSLVTCRWGFKMTVDCGRLGMVCSNGSGNAGCGFGDCSAAQEGATYCVGSDYVTQCTSGRYRPLLDCHTLGATCIGPAGTAQCRGAGAMGCSGGSSCSGTSIIECLGGATATVDCVALYDPSFTCVANNTPSPICAAGSSCDPGTYIDTCSGMNQVSYCNAGIAATYNCRANGWTRCITAHCAP
jgi:hypothetical protein